MVIPTTFSPESEADLRLKCLEIAARSQSTDTLKTAARFASFVLHRPDTAPAPAAVDDGSPDAATRRGLLAAWEKGCVAIIMPEGDDVILSAGMFEAGAIDRMISLLEKERRTLLAVR